MAAAAAAAVASAAAMMVAGLRDTVVAAEDTTAGMATAATVGHKGIVAVAATVARLGERGQGTAAGTADIQTRRQQLHEASPLVRGTTLAAQAARADCMHAKRSLHARSGRLHDCMHSLHAQLACTACMRGLAGCDFRSHRHTSASVARSSHSLSGDQIAGWRCRCEWGDGPERVPRGSRDGSERVPRGFRDGSGRPERATGSQLVVLLGRYIDTSFTPVAVQLCSLLGLCDLCHRGDW